MKTIIDCFTIGGTPAGPSMPGRYLQPMIGTRIAVNVLTRELSIPTPHGLLIAKRGDRVCLYDDGTLGVEYSNG